MFIAPSNIVCAAKFMVIVFFDWTLLSKDRRITFTSLTLLKNGEKAMHGKKRHRWPHDGVQFFTSKLIFQLDLCVEELFECSRTISNMKFLFSFILLLHSYFCYADEGSLNSLRIHEILR